MAGRRPASGSSACPPTTGCWCISLRRDGLQAVALRHRDAHGDARPVARRSRSTSRCSTSTPTAATSRTPTGSGCSYQSMVTPTEVIEYRLADGEPRRAASSGRCSTTPCHGPYRPDDYGSAGSGPSPRTAPAIPISLVYRADTPLDGTARLPALRLRRLRDQHSADLLDRPAEPARPRLRLRGRPRPRRRRARPGLVRATAGWPPRRTRSPTSSPAPGTWSRPATPALDRLAAEGGSAGGLLIGAAINLAPDAVRGRPRRGAVRGRPDHDPRPRAAADRDGVGGVGRPAARPRRRTPRMRRYSPVRERPARRSTRRSWSRPACNDTRVEVTEPAKWVAELRHDYRVVPRPILLKTEMVAGHGGSSGRYQAWRDAAFELAWLIDRDLASVRAERDDHLRSGAGYDCGLESVPPGCVQGIG